MHVRMAHACHRTATRASPWPAALMPSSTSAPLCSSSARASAHMRSQCMCIGASIFCRPSPSPSPWPWHPRQVLQRGLHQWTRAHVRGTPLLGAHRLRHRAVLRPWSLEARAARGAGGDEGRVGGYKAYPQPQPYVTLAPAPALILALASAPYLPLRTPLHPLAGRVGRQPRRRLRLPGWQGRQR